jgi:hypothetical protein
MNQSRGHLRGHPPPLSFSFVSFSFASLAFCAGLIIGSASPRICQSSHLPVCRYGPRKATFAGMIAGVFGSGSGLESGVGTCSSARPCGLVWRCCYWAGFVGYHRANKLDVLRRFTHWTSRRQVRSRKSNPCWRDILLFIPIIYYLHVDPLVIRTWILIFFISYTVVY